MNNPLNPPALSRTAAPTTIPSVASGTVPVALTIEGTCVRYSWTRTFVFAGLQSGALEGLKAGRRTLVTVASADRHFRNLPRASYRQPTVAA